MMTRTLLNQLIIVLDEDEYRITLHPSGFPTVDLFAKHVADIAYSTIIEHYTDKEED